MEKPKYVRGKEKLRLSLRERENDSSNDRHASGGFNGLMN
jgi:hypothetical protein